MAEEATSSMNCDAKCTPDEAETLLKIAPFFGKDSTPMLSIMPWVTNGRDKIMNAPIMLYCLYKCMHQKCIFSTNDAEAMMEHMKQHILLIDAIKTRGKLTNQLRQFHSKFRECCYCANKLHSNVGLIDHVQQAHGASVFQCYHCFYRTIERDNMVQHYSTYHPSTTAVRISSHIAQADINAVLPVNQYYDEIRNDVPTKDCAASMH